MDISKKSKVIVLTIILTGLILGVTISGPKFIYKLQMAFGFKGKIVLIEECLETPGCAITTDELDLYNHYKSLKKSKVGQKIKESDLHESLKEEAQNDKK